MNSELSLYFATTIAFFIVSTLFTSVGLSGQFGFILALSIYANSHLDVSSTLLFSSCILAICVLVKAFRSNKYNTLKATILVFPSVLFWFLGKLFSLPTSISNVVNIVLFLSLGIILLISPKKRSTKSTSSMSLDLSEIRQEILIGSILGLISSLLNVHGSIFIMVCLHIMKWDKTRHIIYTGSYFILLSSLISVLIRFSTNQLVIHHSYIIPIINVVLIGGILGVYIQHNFMSTSSTRKVTGIFTIAYSLFYFFSYLY